MLLLAVTVACLVVCACILTCRFAFADAFVTCLVVFVAFALFAAVFGLVVDACACFGLAAGGIGTFAVYGLALFGIALKDAVGGLAGAFALLSTTSLVKSSLLYRRSPFTFDKNTHISYVI